MKQGIDCKGRQWYEIPLKRSMTDITGQKFGRLTAILPTNLRAHHCVMWLCKCDCGNEILLSSKVLVTNHTKSCGCLKREVAGQNWIGDSYHGGAGKEFIDETRKTYGNLTVLSREPNDSFGKARWKCQCKCGTITVVTGNYLRTGSVRSCGCTKSFGELAIIKLLNKNNIPYKKEYVFDDLKDKSSLRFDFVILNKQNKLLGLIEFQGSQHYINTPIGYYTQEKIDIIKKHDAIKQQYCNKNKIPLLILNKNNYDEDIILEWIRNIQRDSEGENK